MFLEIIIPHGRIESMTDHLNNIDNKDGFNFILVAIVLGFALVDLILAIAFFKYRQRPLEKPIKTTQITSEKRVVTIRASSIEITQNVPLAVEEVWFGNLIFWLLFIIVV